jgi:hypothetical protein
MNIPYFDDHMDSAVLLYRQRCRKHQTALMDAGLMARQEQQLQAHLFVLRRFAPLFTSPSKEAEFFIDLAARLLSPSEAFQKEGCDHALALLEEEDPARRAAFQALALFPPPEADERLVELYREKKSLRPLLFDLWREQSRTIPAGLVSVAELRGNDTTLQIAALRYAAGQPGIGIELFNAYYKGLLSGAGRPEKSGHLMATALWGGLMRGEKNLAKPLLRCIESETDEKSMYHLLRLAAIMAQPDTIDIIRQYGKKHPEEAAELLALHGTGPALAALYEFGATGDLPQGILDAWKWVSGLDLEPGARLRVVPPEGKPGLEPDASSIDHWWQNRPELGEGQRMLMGQTLTPGHLADQCRAWAGRFSRNLLDLLSFTIGSPLGVTAGALQMTRRRAIDRNFPATEQTGDANDSNS